jgi:hypothetical protein
LLLREIFWGARRFDEPARRADITEQMAARPDRSADRHEKKR